MDIREDHTEVAVGVDHTMSDERRMMIITNNYINDMTILIPYTIVIFGKSIRRARDLTFRNVA